jgi:hypothetical protein
MIPIIFLQTGTSLIGHNLRKFPLRSFIFLYITRRVE